MIHLLLIGNLAPQKKEGVGQTVIENKKGLKEISGALKILKSFFSGGVGLIHLVIGALGVFGGVGAMYLSYTGGEISIGGMIRTLILPAILIVYLVTRWNNR